jgi:hypothetical protein
VRRWERATVGEDDETACAMPHGLALVRLRGGDGLGACSSGGTTTGREQRRVSTCSARECDRRVRTGDDGAGPEVVPITGRDPHGA